jgi:diamine N-acetyltransferase
MMSATDAKVTLVEITGETLGPILRLQVSEDQKQFVAPNSVSIAQAHFEERAWFRAIYAGDEPVGFVMLYLDQDKPEYFLWRLMVGAEHQRKGYGYAAMQQVIEYVKSLPNASELKVSYVPQEGSPLPFYEKLGFVETGEVMEGERVMRLAL